MRALGYSILAGLLSVSAAADEITRPADCQYGHSYGPWTYYVRPTDLGNGFISYAVEVEKYDLGEVLVVDCASGATLTVTTTVSGIDTAMSVVLDAARAAEKVTLVELAGRFSAMALEASQFEANVEHCPCAAFYPEKRGEKSIWQNRLGDPMP